MAKVLICGMTPSTARRYVVIRAEIDLVIKQVDKAGVWLCELERDKSDGLHKTLNRMGRSIMHAAAQIQDYLENEFVSVDKIRAEADGIISMND